MARHPEQQADEIFLGNYSPSDYRSVGWHTKRAGTQAYMQNGQPYPYQLEHQVVPVFIKRAEVQQKYDECPSDALKELLEKGSV